MSESMSVFVLSLCVCEGLHSLASACAYGMCLLTSSLSNGMEDMSVRCVDG